MKTPRDKRGLNIEEGDTLVAGDGSGVMFIEVDSITEDGAIVGHDLDDQTYLIEDTYNYVSVCACYRDAEVAA